MSEVRLISITPDAEKIIAYCARVSNPANQENENISGLLKYCINHGHWSIFEMANMVIEIKTTRAISAQILRHRSFSFQEFCIAEDSKISLVYPSGKQVRKSIKWLYCNQNKPLLVRIYDENSRQISTATIKEVFDTGKKDVYKISLASGRSIKATLNHKFMIKDGFTELLNLKKGDQIAVNGEICYRDAEWMRKEKLKSIENGTGVEGIAIKAGVSYHTIRKWLKKLNLQFTKKETASYTKIWNKGLEKEMQPRFGKNVSDETRRLQHESSRKGPDSNLYKGGSARKWRQQVFDWQNKYKNKLRTEQPNCRHCESSDNLETDHIIPVSQNPELAFSYDNLQSLCKECHKIKSANERKVAVKWDLIESIDYVGELQTYDIEVNHTSHNYVANGIITHNSQRYALQTEFETQQARRQDLKNRQNSINDVPEDIQLWFQDTQKYLANRSIDAYNEAIRKGIAKECARALLPMSTSTTLYMNGTIRSYIHYLNLRCHKDTQLEHRVIADKIREIFKENLPIIGELI